MEQQIPPIKNKTEIIIRLSGGKVHCFIEGEREELIEALATLMTDTSNEGDSFRKLMEDAMNIVMFENFEEIRKEQKMLKFKKKEPDIIN